MNKPATRQRTTFHFAQRADLFVTSHAADLLTNVLHRKEAFRKRLKDKAFRDELTVYGAIATSTFATGALVSLVTAVWIK